MKDKAGKGSSDSNQSNQSNDFEAWLNDHYQQAVARYEKLSDQDDEEESRGENSGVYEEAHQMFGYVAALETCLKEIRARKSQAH